MQRSLNAHGPSMWFMVLLAGCLAVCLAQSPALPAVPSTAVLPDATTAAALVTAQAFPDEADPSDDTAAVRATHHSSSWNQWVWFSGWYKSLSSSVRAASKLPQMSTLLAAVNAAGVAAPLGDKNTAWTILAPTSDAFEDLLEARGVSAEQLLGNKALLQEVLSYHVIPAAALNSRQLQNQAYPTALQGASVTIKKRSSGSVRITGGSTGNRANVVAANIRAGSSIIHVIDTVLLPPGA